MVQGIQVSSPEPPPMPAIKYRVTLTDEEVESLEAGSTSPKSR